MPIDPVIRQRLIENNPFSSNAAGDPMENSFPDVESVDRQVTQGIIRVIDQKCKQPGAPRAAAVLGETGSGKTHLIARLIRIGDRRENPFPFAYMRPFIDPNRAFRYLLREIVGNLSTVSLVARQCTQFGYFCGKILAGALIDLATQQNNADMLAFGHELDHIPYIGLKMRIKPMTQRKLTPQVKNFLLNRHASLNTNFVNVLTQYLLVADKRPSALRWMMGKMIDRQDCELLGVPDRTGLGVDVLEGEAQQILQCLNVVLEFYGDHPLVIFFDQLENLDSRELLFKFRQLSWYLSDVARAMMPIAFFRGLDWDKRFKSQMDDTMVSRFNSNLFMLTGCTQAQAHEIVECRLQVALQDVERPHKLYPFVPDHVEQFNKRINARIIWPRTIISRANQMLSEILNITSAPRTDNQILDRAFKDRYQDVLANFDKFQPDEGRLTLALTLYLSNCPESQGYRLGQLTRSATENKYLDMVGQMAFSTGSARQVAFIIDVALHHGKVGASLRSGIEFLKTDPSHGAVLIRDMRCAFPQPPKWPATHALLQDFQALGGGVIFLDMQAVAHWYALALLKFDVEAGDISRDNGAAVGLTQLKQFIAQCLNVKACPAFAMVDNYFQRPPADASPAPAQPIATPADVPDDMLQQISDLLRATPANMMRTDVLAANISEKIGRVIDAKALARMAAAFHDRFTVIRLADGAIIKLKQA